MKRILYISNPMATTAKKIKKTGDEVATGVQASFAVIKTGGKQYRVSSGTTITIEKMSDEHKVGDKVEFGEVIMKDNGSETVLGTPTIAGAKVSGEIAEIGRDAKVIIMRYKQKSRSGNAKNGHRQPHVKVRITAIA